MVEQNILEEMKSRLVATYNPLEIYLFDPYPTAPFDEDTTFEVGVVVPAIEGTKGALVEKGHEALWGLHISKDLFVYDHKQFAVMKQEKSTMPYHLATRGTRIYAKNNT